MNELILKRLVPVITEQLNVKAAHVVLSAHFINDLGADSLDVVELIMVVEDKFGVDISDADAETMATVGDLVKYLDAHPN